MPRLSRKEWIARNLAQAFLSRARNAGAVEYTALQTLAGEVLGGTSPLWLKATLEALGRMSAAAWQASDVGSLTREILCAPGFDPPRVGDAVPCVRKIFLDPPLMRLPGWPLGSVLPAITTVQELADWLGLPSDRLAWLASRTQAWREHQHQHQHQLKRTAHYRYRLQAKRQGGLRLIEIPKVDLKHAQQHILRGLLQRIPVHEAAHGFVRGRSVASHAKIHTDQAVVMRFDLQDFFPSIRASRIHGMWKTLGYPAEICRVLTALCTTRTSAAVIERLHDENVMTWAGKKRLAAPHLPQGAPTSPALANLCAFSLDVRLAGLAEVFGARYTRYADDLVFSGPNTLVQRLPNLKAWVAFIAEEEGFKLHLRKTRCMPQHAQQRITGLVVNQRAHTPRQDYDRLRAQLHQCVLYGPSTQNRNNVADFKNHLLGQINWVGQFNSTRQAKLMQLFVQIKWLL